MKLLTFLQNGQLIPLPGLSISYNHLLELQENTTHQIRTGPFSNTSFSYMGTLVNYCSLKGYIFRKSEAAESRLLEKVPHLLFPLKRLEKNFIDVHSDPFYLSLVKKLERAQEMLETNQKEYLELALGAYEQGRMLIEEVFKGDKLLELLVKDLGRQLITAWQLKQSNSAQSEKVIPWQSPTPPEKKL